jgi:hypothetical protein
LLVEDQSRDVELTLTALADHNLAKEMAPGRRFLVSEPHPLDKPIRAQGRNQDGTRRDPALRKHSFVPQTPD